MFQSTFESYHYIKLHHSNYLFSVLTFNMAFSYPQHHTYLSQNFKIKARGVFQVPLWHYVTNDELAFYWDILQNVGSDGEARIARALACGTNPNCQCFACLQAEDREGDSTVSFAGDEADDEGDSTRPRDDSGDITPNDLLDTTTWGTYSYYNTSQPPASPDPSSPATADISSDVLNSTTGSVVSSVGTQDDPSVVSVIVVSDEGSSEGEVIVISSEDDKTVVASPPLPALDSVWNSTFLSPGYMSETLEWVTLQQNKRRRQGLNFGPFQDHQQNKRRRTKPFFHLSPIPHHSDAGVWKQEPRQDKHRL